MPLRIIVTGSRDWSDPRPIRDALREAADGLSEEPTVIHGGANGADAIAAQAATTWGWNVERHDADWKKRGKAAGPMRNVEMVAAGADVVLAFPIGDRTASPGPLLEAHVNVTVLPLALA